MVVTQKVAPGRPAGQGVKVTRNVDYPTYLKAVETAAGGERPEGRWRSA